MKDNGRDRLCYVRLPPHRPSRNKHVDTLLAGGESDWFFAKLGEDKVNDLEAEEVLTAL